jgi:hypothetical protein
MTVVRFLATPVAGFIDLQGGLDGLQREVHLTTLQGTPTVDPAVVEGMVVAREAMDEVRTTLHDQARAARDAGLAVVDLEADYPAEHRQRIMDTMAASRAVNAQLVTQLDGGPATPYDPRR